MYQKFYLTWKRKTPVKYFNKYLPLTFLVMAALFLDVSFHPAMAQRLPPLGAAQSFAALAGTTITATASTVISGNLGVSPGSAVTGFPPAIVLNGNIYTGVASPAGAAKSSARDAFDSLAVQPYLPANDLSGKILGETAGAITLTPGVYFFSSSAQLNSTLTLDDGGDSNAIFIFRIGTTLISSSGAKVIMSSGSRGINVYWQVGSSATIGTFTSFRGNIIANISITFTTGAYTTGRVFALTGAATIDACFIEAIPMRKWTGAAGTSDWFTQGNWDGGVPDGTLITLIPTTLLAGRVFPIIDNGIARIDSLIIQNAGTLTVTNSTLQINGAINNNGTLNAGNGTIEMTGSSSQTIAANTYQNDSIKNLIVSNSSTGGVILAGALDIYGSLTYSVTGMKLTTNDNLTLKSTALNTAWIGDMTGKTITGKVTVERYIAAHKAWQFLSIPTNTTQTVKQAWQEGAISNDSNPVSGYGIQITGAGDTIGGFDVYTATPSMKTYDPANNVWVGIPNTNTETIKTKEGYMVFVRGDRTANTFTSTSTETVLRTKGSLYTGDQASIPVSAGKFASIGNPYASPLDMRYITKTGVKDFFYVWDPRLGGSYGYGGYQTFSNNGEGDYVITPGEGSYGPAGSDTNYLQSGQAFFVQADSIGSGSLTFKEDAKISSVPQISLAARLPQPQLQFRASLYGINADNSTYMTDGLLINYDDTYSNSIDDMDAIKSTNTSENLSIKSANTLLVIERRHTIGEKDTIFLNLTNTKVQKYRFGFNANQLGLTGLNCILEDNYLHTSTPLNLNGSTIVNFNIAAIPGSSVPDRFRIVFSQLSTLPVTLNLKAYQKNNDIAVEWTVENENNLKQYALEKSVDGNHYAIASTVEANYEAPNNYNWLDANPSEGYNYYRVHRTDINGKTTYSTVVKVFMGKGKQSMSIYPNPITGGIINLQFTNEPGGIYEIRLLNKMGQEIVSKQINHVGGSNTETIRLDKNSAHGGYQLAVTRPDGDRVNMNVIY